MVKMIYLYATVITTIIFVIGIFTGFYVSRIKVRNVEKQLSTNEFEIESLDMEIDILKNLESKSACDYLDKRLPKLASKKTELANKFEEVNEEDAKNLEKEFTYSLVRYWLFMKIQGEKCNIDNPMVLFFHKRDGEQSRQQGVVLDYWVYKLKETNESLSVFGFSTDLKEPLIDLLKNIYNVEKIPSIVIEGDTYPGLQDKGEVENLLCDHYNLTVC
ncbi:MAG: hypothetical protein ACOCP4_07350 [Candidatus Woesearchaeota archaeon]